MTITTSRLTLLSKTITVIITFYKQIQSVLLPIKYVFQRQDLQFDLLI